MRAVRNIDHFFIEVEHLDPQQQLEFGRGPFSAKRLVQRAQVRVIC
jgi:hypothetical protein